MEKVPNESKIDLTYYCSVLVSIVSAWKSFKHKNKLLFHFCGDVNVSVNENRDI